MHVQHVIPLPRQHCFADLVKTLVSRWHLHRRFLTSRAVLDSIFASPTNSASVPALQVQMLCPSL